MRKEIEILAKLYKCNDTAKRFFSENYDERIKSYKNVIIGHQKRFNLDVLPSVIEICSLDSVKDDGMMTMMFMSAAVDLLETENKKQ